MATTSTLVLEANPYRKRVTFVNDGTNIIYLIKGPVGIINQGIRLNANGGSYEDAPDPSGYLWRGQYFAIAAVATNVLTYQEEN